LGVGNPKACAIGKTSVLMFKKLGIDWSVVEKRAAYQALTVNELGQQIQVGTLDAVVVWDAIAVFYEKHGEIITIPPAENVVTEVAAGTLNTSSNPAAAKAFVEFLTTEQAKAVLRKHKYRVEAPKNFHRESR
jgi:molybdate transport system substrate-binding protein